MGGVFFLFGLEKLDQKEVINSLLAGFTWEEFTKKSFPPKFNDVFLLGVGGNEWERICECFPRAMEAWARGDLLFLSDLEAGKVVGISLRGKGEKSCGQRAYLPFHHFLKLMRQCKKNVLLESDRKQLLSFSIFAAKDARRHALFLHWLGWPSMPHVVRLSWVSLGTFRGIAGPWKHENRKTWQTSRSRGE